MFARLFYKGGDLINPINSLTKTYGIYQAAENSRLKSFFIESVSWFDIQKQVLPRRKCRELLEKNLDRGCQKMLSQ
ncbi:hypothetical protein [Enterobacter chuandaensis]|uniref:hypothetical protein n=1 Tax=Enterobacter chuandaensis TaxID=2497875 RepID=UPI001C2EFD66|nr:hypothetical protein [Enterobacter chuandaensis]